MKKLKLTFVFIALATLTCFSQLQNRYWYFGNNAGIDFGNLLNNPQPISGIGNNQGEGVASISDQLGNFLFYTDGNKILRGLNNLVPATLLGDGSSSQSSIIVPSPDSCDLFYIFTVDECYNAARTYGNSVGLQYATVNRSSWVVSNSTRLDSTCCEKVTAIPHSNGTDYWIVSVRPSTKDLIVYSLTSAGVILHKTITINNLSNNFRKGRFGYIKSSLDGTLIAIASGFEGNKGENGNTQSYSDYKSWVDLLRFNPATGDVTSFLKTFETFKNGTKTDTITGAYGVEFSPNGNNLFVSGLGWVNNKKGYLYCFSTTSPYNLIDYETITSSVSSSYVVGALQLGPDNKIYLAQNGATTLGVISNPNNPNFDFAKDFKQNGLNLNCTNCPIGLGLPNLLPTFNMCESSNTCCPNSLNLIQNTNFNKNISTNPGFTSQYKPINSTSKSPLNPGEYAILNPGDAKAICRNWDVKDHSTCLTNGAGNFLVVNGKTGQPNSKKVIWEQTLNGLKGGAEYKFCANFKNLSQCCFDVKPKIDIKFSITGFDLLNQTINVTSANNCGWVELTKNINTGGISPINLKIQIILDESGNGDGNDLAIDDIALVEMRPLDSIFNTFNLSTTVINNSNGDYNITAFPMNSLPNGNGFSWSVCEIDALDSNNDGKYDKYDLDNDGVIFECNSATCTLMSNPSQWWTTSTSFPGYNGTCNLDIANYPNTGVFKKDKMYLIGRGTFSPCNAYSDQRVVLGYIKSSNQVRVSKISGLNSSALKKIALEFGLNK